MSRETNLQQPYRIVTERPGAHYPTRHPADEEVALHRHRSAYLALVLEGAYEEWSADGRFRLERGDLILHGPFHAHGNRILTRARVVNLVLLEAPRTPAKRVARLDRPASWAAAIRRDPAAAAERLLEALQTRPRRTALQPCGRLNAAAEALRSDEAVPIAELARRTARMTPEHFSRRFRDHFGMPPRAYRAEHRFRRALQRLHGRAPLASVALEAGYADQSHMSRDLRQRTGQSPRHLAAGV